MRKLLAILFIVPFISCSVEAEKSTDYNITGEWVLVQTVGQFAGSQETGEDMPFQETYTINEDGSFTKVRVREGEVMEATGTYELSETGWTINGEEAIVFIEFQYEAQNPLIANCTTEFFTEQLYFTTAGQLRSTQEACDGLALRYEKSNQ